MATTKKTTEGTATTETKTTTRKETKAEKYVKERLENQNKTLIKLQESEKHGFDVKDAILIARAKKSMCEEILNNL